MASIKEIAKLAGISMGTASFVLNGKGDQMRISKATQEKVLAAAKELGYRPNISARRLRSEGEKVVPVIAILWTLDTRVSLISRFLEGIQGTFAGQGDGFELMVQPYENSKLDKLNSLITGTRFNGAIVANASDEDIAYLENNEINVPIVLYQRKSDKYSTVSVDSYQSGVMVADLFANRGHKTSGIILPNVSSQAVRLRKEGFMDRAHSYGLQVPSNHIVSGSFSEEGGYQCVKELISKGELPSSLFTLSDQMAVGALTALYEEGIRVPQDVEIMGHDNNENTKFTIPSLSTIHLPVEEMAAACVNMLMDLIEQKVKAPVSKLFNSSFVIRQSCGGVCEDN
ncbi:LacI family DNA-binding transcriptional regulator [Neobacillus vireti]|uniref:LacI family transcription regulator n=1 Tax=Neobacillus vireti LMG 21834 TaxID=1131730 RepID=A0AB94ISY0_9BACI|nr:LacI family DNA-binding transcriptional regulator [Neobacillus vireti]ETI70164.1 LacI family transcription regulator [Neobacillus vireti LMG 21834]KLT16467.1 hypothetical protein AA980_18515 [Neobacillus vireti]